MPVIHGNDPLDSLHVWHTTHRPNPLKRGGPDGSILMTSLGPDPGDLQDLEVFEGVPTPRVEVFVGVWDPFFDPPGPFLRVRVGVGRSVHMV